MYIICAKISVTTENQIASYYKVVLSNNKGNQWMQR